MTNAECLMNNFDDGFGRTGRYTLLFLGGGVGYEFFPIRGKLRLMPLIGGNRVQTNPVNENDTDLAGSSYGIEAGADVGIRFSPTLELTGTLRRAAYLDPLSIEVSQGFIFGIGARLQRGRFGF